MNELDRCSKDAQDMLLTYLDRMQPDHAFLGTTNLDLSSLTERFQTRFQSVRLQPPDIESRAAFLARRWGAPITITRQIAAGAKGNVRAAMADLEMWMG
ncbi:MAG: hypothetical protein NTW21_23630 [Verrucomicrobia bacterium]|nr:hypothetical protein [Verrucomicrobiota bacterium]